MGNHHGTQTHDGRGREASDAKEADASSSSSSSAAKGRGGEHALREGRGRTSTVITGEVSDVRTKYKIDPKELGHGHYGVVRKCQDRSTHEWFACKTIRKSKVGRIESLRREIEILQTVDHPNIIRLVDVFEDEKFLHLITELCTGGELFDRIIAKTQSSEGHYSERDAAVIVQKILGAIEYIHNVHNICHRDLKPENFLFANPDDDSELKIIDFGLSRFDDISDHMHTRVGTPYYIAPEVLRRDYDKACDLWSIGVITYILLCGFPPFYGNSDQEIFRSIQSGTYDFPSPEWDDISDNAKDFINTLLQMDPASRPTASEAVNHTWFSEVDAMPPAMITENIKQSLSRFMNMNKLKKVALHVIAQQMTESEIGNLQRVFQTIDTDGNGVISIEELREAMEKEGLRPLRREIEHLMAGLDIDGNQNLDYNEFLAATMEVNTFIRDNNVRKAFEYFDADKTGFITYENLEELFGSAEHAREVIGDVDVDGDGRISYDEFKIMMQQNRFGNMIPPSQRNETKASDEGKSSRK